MNNIKKKQPPKGLGVFAFEGLSQLIISSFMAPAQKSRESGAQIVLITSPQLAPFGSYFNYDRVIAVEPVDLNGFRVKVLLKIYFWLMGIRRFASLDVKPEIVSALSENFLCIQFAGKTGDLLTRYQNLLMLLNEDGVDLYEKNEPLNQKIKVSAQRYNKAQRKVLDKGLKLKKYIIFSNQISFLNQKKFENAKWPYFRSALKHTLESSDYSLVVLIDSKEAPTLNDLVLDFPERLFIMPPQKFEETVVLLEHSRAFVGIDGEAAVLSRQLGVPTLILYGPGYERYLPEVLAENTLQGQVPCSPCLTLNGDYQWSCKDNVCMKSISPKQVFDRLSQIVNF